MKCVILAFLTFLSHQNAWIPNVWQNCTMLINSLPTTFTCPACGLLCDDITPSHNSCSKSITFFGQALGDSKPKIKGKNASLTEAINAAACIIKKSQQVLFSGLSTDITGFKSLYSLAKKTNGSLQHINHVSMIRNLKVLQNSGWQTTTLGEVKNRADLLLCIGTDVVSHNPRFFERFIDIEGMFTGGNISKREVIYLGVENPSKGLLSLNCKKADLTEVLGVLHALILDKSLKIESVAGIKIEEILSLASKLRASKYAVLVWIANDMNFPHAELTIELITKIVATLNQTTRAAGLPLGGSDGDTSINNAHTWLTGLSLNNEIYTEHDALVWVNSFSPEKMPPKTNVPIIVFGNSNTQFAQTPDVFIPISTPGLDCAGTLFRVDGSVILPLKKIRDNSLPSLQHLIVLLSKVIGNEA